MTVLLLYILPDKLYLAFFADWREANLIKTFPTAGPAISFPLSGLGTSTFKTVPNCAHS